MTGRKRIDQRGSDAMTEVVRAAAIGTLLLLAGCAPHIAPEELAAQIESGNSPTILDVRSTREYRAGHIPGAIHVPFWTLAFNLDTLPPAAKTGPVVIHCEHGPRAGIALAQLWFVDTGEIHYLEGHMTRWRDAGLPLSQAD